MTTERQIASNRRNGRRSKGPVTAEGKALAAASRMKHGMRSRAVLLADEDEEAFGQMNYDLHEELNPQSALEIILTRRIVAGAWRLNRAARMETEMLAQRDLLGEPEQPGAVFAQACQRGTHEFILLARYERQIERGVYRALHELERRQALRGGVEVAPPIALDVADDKGEMEFP